MHHITTIGYEAASVPRFLQTLVEHRIELLVDIRAVASSRRPGFAKTALAANLETAGIRYRHMRALGTPSDGRAAARAGKHEEMRRIFLDHLATHDAQAALFELGELVKSGERICLLCFEADPRHCHRSIVATALQAEMPLTVEHLAPWPDDD